MNFKILTVNGEDLSGASHEAAAEAFRKASEPITVVLRRNQNSNNNNNNKHFTDNSGAPGSEKSLRSDDKAKLGVDGMCFCQFLIENCHKMPSHISSLIVNELLRYQTAFASQELESESSNQNYDFGSTTADNCYYVDDYDDVFGVHYEEVTLNRASSRDRLGIMLSDYIDQQSGGTKVLVNEVAVDSIAAKSENIFEGDQIVKVNGVAVSCTNEASHLLSKENSPITFLICRQNAMDEAQWHEENSPCQLDAIDETCEDRVLHDLTNRGEEESTTSEESRPRYLEQCSRGEAVEYAAIISQKLSCEAMGTTDSGSSSHSSKSASSRNEQDSGIGQGTGSTVQSNASKCITDVRRFGTGSSGASTSHSAAQEFTFVPAQKYEQKKRPVSHKLSNTTNADSGDSAKGSMERHTQECNNGNLQRLSDAIGKLEINPDPQIRIPCDPFAQEDDDDNLSPWVKIARQDYQEKIKQFENITDARVIHPALSGEDDTLVSSATRSDSVATDNTSSAYSTGDSFRSSSSASGQHMSGEGQSPPLSPEKPLFHRDYNSNSKPAVVTMSYYVSSDANSDGEGPGCYLTHDDESGSEGFADAGLEFSSVFTADLNSNQHTPVQQTKSAPTPAVRHSLCANNFMNSSVTASTRQLFSAAAHVAKTRRNTASGGETQSDCTDRSNSASRSKNKAANQKSQASEYDMLPMRGSNVQIENQAPPQQARRKSRRSSEQSKKPLSRPTVTNRSFSYTEGQTDASDQKKTLKSTNDASLEWKVRVRNDGTRYITKRPVREQMLRERERRLLAERCGVTTDDDVTELKLGRHWSRDERKRHVRIAREKKRRKDFMQRCRLEALNEKTPADGEIVELSHKKMARRKHKRMLLDNFVTVQEILAHGDRTTGVAKLNPLLSVTYI